MKTALLAGLLLLPLVAVPVASASHVYQPCMYIWLDPPPGWHHVCLVADWASHNPVGPLAACLIDPLEIYIIGFKYDIKEALACL